MKFVLNRQMSRFNIQPFLDHPHNIPKLTLCFSCGQTPYNQAMRSWKLEDIYHVQILSFLSYKYLRNELQLASRRLCKCYDLMRLDMLCASTLVTCEIKVLIASLSLAIEVHFTYFLFSTWYGIYFESIITIAVWSRLQIP